MHLACSSRLIKQQGSRQFRKICRRSGPHAPHRQTASPNALLRDGRARNKQSGTFGHPRRTSYGQGVRAPANREIISQENDANGPVFRGRRDEAAVIAERRRGHLDRSTPAEKQASAVKCSDRKLILQQNSTKYAAWRSGALKKRRRWRIETKDKQLWKCACQRRWRC